MASFPALLIMWSTAITMITILLRGGLTMSTLTLAPALSIQTLILLMVRLKERLKLHCRRYSLYLSSFALVFLCFVVYSLDANALSDTPTNYVCRWVLSNHQSVNYSLAPGTSVLRGWTLCVEHNMEKGQVYYIRNSPALSPNDQNSGTSFSIHDVIANFDGFHWWIDGDRFYYFSDRPAAWVRVYVSYNHYNNTGQEWHSVNTPSLYVEPVTMSYASANVDAVTATNILDALNNINGSVTAADQEARKRLEAINNSLNNAYTDLTRPSDSAVSSAGDSLSDTSDVEAATGLFTSIDNLTQGVFNCFSNPGSTELIFPGFGLNIDGVSYKVWDDTSYNLSDIDDKFGGLMSVVRFATSLLVYLALIRYLVSVYHRIFGGGE